MQQSAYRTRSALGSADWIPENGTGRSPIAADRRLSGDLMMRKAIAGLVVMLGGCGLQRNYILVMTTFSEHGYISIQTVIQEFRSKEKCQFAGDQWRSSPWMNDSSEFACLEPKP
jgi:hypothetical protein